MTGSRQPQLNEELLSAYLDNEVTVEERTLVEAAIAADPAVAWQVESLRQTVHLLQALPPLALPRAFTLDTVAADAQVIKAVTAAQAEPVQRRVVNTRPVAKPTTNEQQSIWWQRFLQIWQGGNLHLRNAAAVAFTLLIVLFASNRFVAPTHLRQPTAMPVPVTKVMTTSSEVTASEAMVMTTAPIETATTVAETAATPSVAVNAYQIPETPSPSAKIAPDQESTVAGLSAAKQPPAALGQPGEDTFDMSGGRPGSFGAPAGPSGSIASTGADDSRIRATVSSEAAAIMPSDSNTTANKVSAAASTTTTVATTVAETVAMTATITVTPTATITPSASLSVTEQASSITNTEVLTAAPATSTDTPVAPSAATASWLTWAELMVGLCTVVLGSLWWRSREGAHA